MKMGRWGVTLVALALICVAGVPGAQAGPANVRLTHDDGSSGGYVSDYTLATGTPYTDAVLTSLLVRGWCM
jgi:hypothetical protein